MSDHHPNKSSPQADPPPETDPPPAPTTDPLAVPGEEPQLADEAEQVSISGFGERAPRGEEVPTPRSADEIVERARGALRADPRTQHVADQVVIEMTGDIARLLGQVDTPATADACAAVVQAVAGIAEVRNELQSA
jgi:osmotically-inducible protein OsmY